MGSGKGTVGCARESPGGDIRHGRSHRGQRTPPRAGFHGGVRRDGPGRSPRHPFSQLLRHVRRDPVERFHREARSQGIAGRSDAVETGQVPRHAPARGADLSVAARARPRSGGEVSHGRCVGIAPCRDRRRAGHERSAAELQGGGQRAGCGTPEARAGCFPAGGGAAGRRSRAIRRHRGLRVRRRGGSQCRRGS